MNELLLNNDLTVLNNSLQHEGRKGMEWHRHKYGKWQEQAVYANGMPDPEAKRKTPSKEEKKKRTSMEAYSQSAAKLRMREMQRATKAADKEERLKQKIQENPEKYSQEKAEKKLNMARANTKRTEMYAQDAINKSKRVDAALDKYVNELKKKYGDTNIKDLKYEEKYKNGQSLGKYLKSNALLKRTVSTEAKNALMANISTTLGLPLVKYDHYEPGTNKKKTDYYLNVRNRNFGILDAAQLAYVHNKTKQK